MSFISPNKRAYKARLDLSHLLTLLFQIRIRHIEWLLRTGEELDRKCEFAAALKYYYAGKVYYSKLDEHGYQLHGCGVSEILNGFEENRDGLYSAMCGALKEIAEQNKDWSERHSGILLGPWCGPVDKHIQLLHLKHSLCPGDAQPCLETVRRQQL